MAFQGLGGLSPVANEWYVEFDGKQHGPFSAAQLRAMAQQGQVTGGARVRRGEGGPWIAAHQVQGLFDAPEPDLPTLPLPGAGHAPASPAQGPRAPALHGPAPAQPGPVAGPSGAGAHRLPAPAPAAFTPPEFVPEDKEAGPAMWFWLWGFTSIAAMVMFALLIYAIRSATREGPSSLVATGPGAEGPVAPQPGVATPAGGTSPSSTAGPARVPPDPAEALAREAIFDRASPSVAAIKGDFGVGSGFLVAPGVVATNRHVVAGEFIEHLEIYFPSDKRNPHRPHSVSLLYSHERRDLAFLTVSTDLPPLPVAAESDFHPGATVVVIGSPGSGKLDVDTWRPEQHANILTTGAMSGKIEDDEGPFYYFDVTVNPGNSGGPALDSRGQVIGVVQCGVRGKDRMNYFIPAPVLSAAVARLSRLSSQETSQNQSLHRLLAGISVMGDYRDLVMGHLEKVARSRSVDAKEVLLLKVLTQKFAKAVGNQAPKISGDANLQPEARRKFADVWARFQQLSTSAVNHPVEEKALAAGLKDLEEKSLRLSAALKAF